MIIGPKLSGSYHFIAELFTDLELSPDQPYQGTCGQCFRCGAYCPTGAIEEASSLNAGLCISYLTIENKEGIPLSLRKQLGEWLFGCDLCQEICPYNQRPPETPWLEFQPSSGVGHYVNLLALLDIKSQEQFLQQFGNTPLRRPKRRGLTRNALVVMGNRQPDGQVDRLYSFATDEPDAMLREHACWALSQWTGTDARQAALNLYDKEPDKEAKILMSAYL